MERGSSVSILGPAADPQILDGTVLLHYYSSTSIGPDICMMCAVDEHSKPADDLMRGFQEDDNSDDDSTHSSKLKLQRQTHKQSMCINNNQSCG